MLKVERDPKIQKTFFQKMIKGLAEQVKATIEILTGTETTEKEELQQLKMLLTVVQLHHKMLCKESAMQKESFRHGNYEMFNKLLNVVISKCKDAAFIER